MPKEHRPHRPFKIDISLSPARYQGFLENCLSNFMTNANHPLWLYLTAQPLSTARTVTQILRSADKTVQQSLSWLHNTLLETILRKEGSVEGFITHVKRLAGPNAEAEFRLLQQFNECSLIAEAKEDDERAAVKTTTPAELVAKTSDEVCCWLAAHETAEIMLLVDFLGLATVIALGGTDSLAKAASSKNASGRGAALAAALRFLKNISNRLVPDEHKHHQALYNSAPHMSWAAWPTFAAALRPVDRGFFLRFTQLLFTGAFGWMEEVKYRKPAVPIPSLEEYVGLTRNLGDILTRSLAATPLTVEGMQAADAAIDELGPEHMLLEMVGHGDELSATHVQALQALPPDDRRTLTSALVTLGRCWDALVRDQAHLTVKDLKRRYGRNSDLFAPSLLWLKFLSKQLA